MHEEEVCQNLSACKGVINMHVCVCVQGLCLHMICHQHASYGGWGTRGKLLKGFVRILINNLHTHVHHTVCTNFTTSQRRQRGIS